MKREIKYKIIDSRKVYSLLDGQKFSPVTRQWGGMQFEDNNTEIIFDISSIDASDAKGLIWRIDFDSAVGGYNPSEVLTVEKGELKRPLPYDMTRHGGDIQVTLVGTEVDEQQNELRTAYSIPVVIYLTEVEQHEDSAKEIAPRMSAAEISALSAANRAEQAAREAAESEEAAELAQEKTEEARRALEEDTMFVFCGGDSKGSAKVKLVIDSELSISSSNPVENRVVSAKLETLENQTETNRHIVERHAQNIEAMNSKIDAAVLAAHPIGSLYWSEDPTNPAELFGGTWERIKDRFILAAGDKYVAGSDGGEAEVKLKIEHMPKHTHQLSLANYGNDSASVVKWETTSDAGKFAYGGDMIEAVGNDQPHNNMPPYEVYYCFKRIG